MKQTLSDKLLAIDQWLWDQCRDAAQEWFMKQSRNNYAQLYLWFRRGNLTVAEDQPFTNAEPFQLANGARLGPMGTQDQIKFKIYGIARTLPVLPENLCS